MSATRSRSDADQWRREAGGIFAVVDWRAYSRCSLKRVPQYEVLRSASIARASSSQNQEYSCIPAFFALRLSVLVTRSNCDVVILFCLSVLVVVVSGGLPPRWQIDTPPAPRQPRIIPFFSFIFLPPPSVSTPPHPAAVPPSGSSSPPPCRRPSALRPPPDPRPRPARPRPRRGHLA